MATEAWRLLRRARTTGGDLASLDTARLRLDFPCRVRIHLRSGERLEVDGVDEGACGAPLDEQRAVVQAKEALVGSQVG